MARVKAVIFDLNGVFLESEFLSKRMAKEYGVLEDEFYAALKVVMDVIRRPGVKDAFKVWQSYLEKMGLSISKDEFFSFWFSGEKPVPAFIDYCRKLRSKGIKVIILSNNFKERTEYYRKNFPEIFIDVDAAYFSWETGFVKPDPQAYKNILTKHNLKPEECIYFDDQDKNIKVAKDLGIDSQKYEGLERIKTYLADHK